MADVTERTLTLLTILQSGGSFSAEHLAARLRVSPRTLRRDVDRLRGYGYPVDTRPGPGGYYRLAAGRTMPPLLLDDDEAVATMLALATMAGSSSPPPVPSRAGRDVADAAATAYGKLAQFLPARLRPRAEAVRRALEPPRGDAPGVPAQRFALLSDAVARHEVLTFTYSDGRGRVRSRRVEPHAQVYHLLRWYLVGWDLHRGDWRTFRIDRISEADQTGRPFTPRSLPAESALEHVRAGTGRTGTPVRLVVEAPAAEVLDALRYQDVAVSPVTDGRCEVTVGFENWQWLMLNLAFLDADFRVVEPAEFRAKLQEFGRRLLAADGEATGEATDTG